MTEFDYLYDELLRRILSEGTEVENRTGINTIKIPSHTLEFDLNKEFPILTTKQMFYKQAIIEILWIWQKQSNNIKDLDAHIWDAWADEDGSIGKTYSYQLAQKYNLPEGYMDQVDALIYNLKNNPMNRRMIVTMWNPKDLKEMKAQVSKANYEQRQYNNLDFLYANNINNEGDN